MDGHVDLVVQVFNHVRSRVQAVQADVAGEHHVFQTNLVALGPGHAADADVRDRALFPDARHHPGLVKADTLAPHGVGMGAQVEHAQTGVLLQGGAHQPLGDQVAAADTRHQPVLAGMLHRLGVHLLHRRLRTVRAVDPVQGEDAQIVDIDVGLHVIGGQHLRGLENGLRPLVDRQGGRRGAGAGHGQNHRFGLVGGRLFHLRTEKVHAAAPRGWGCGAVAGPPGKSLPGAARR